MIKKPQRIRARAGETDKQTLRRWRSRIDEYRDALVMQTCTDEKATRKRRALQAFTGIQMKWLIEVI